MPCTKGRPESFHMSSGQPASHLSVDSYCETSMLSPFPVRAADMYAARDAKAAM